MEVIQSYTVRNESKLSAGQDLSVNISIPNPDAPGQTVKVPAGKIAMVRYDMHITIVDAPAADE